MIASLHKLAIHAELRLIGVISLYVITTPANCRIALDYFGNTCIKFDLDMFWNRLSDKVSISFLPIKMISITVCRTCINTPDHNQVVRYCRVFISLNYSALTYSVGPVPTWKARVTGSNPTGDICFRLFSVPHSTTEPT